MNYNELRNAAIKTAVDLTNAMLDKEAEGIELLNYKLNDLIVNMLEKLNEPKYENTNTKIEGVSKNLKKWR